jgi:transcriptional regulator GlxA family with amidase domain
VIAAFDGLHSLDLVGPLEVFDAASKVLASAGGGPGYRVVVAADRPGPVRTSSGLALFATAGRDELTGDIDTLLVPGGSGSRQAVRDQDLVDWVGSAAGRSRLVASVCTGAFVLATAGLLDGRRATTHWAHCDALARHHPAVRVEPGPIYTRDGDVWTSAGVTAGIDLALALVDADLGRDVALAVARWLVMFLHRPGDQAQFSAALAGQAADRAEIRAVQSWLVDHVDADLSVDALARRAAMSPRTFARAFRREVGTTPGRYVEKVRVEAARRRLVQSDDGVDRVATRCGFGTAETMRRSFLRVLGVPPTDYRRRFTAPSQPSATPFRPPDPSPSGARGGRVAASVT